MSGRDQATRAGRRRSGGALSLLLLAGLGWGACADGPPEPAVDTAAAERPARVPAGTAAMAARLDALIRSEDPAVSFISDDPAARIAFVRARVGGARNHRDRVVARNAVAAELLALGRTEEAVSTYDALLAELAGRLPAAEEAWLRTALATAHLRRAEQDNCQFLTDPRACLLPLRDGGLHRRPEGARAAARELERVLALTPEDLGARWLLNLAHMSLGSHPSGVAERWRLEAEMFGGADGVPEFPNVAAAAGVDVLGLSGGVVVEDLDGDGLLDLVASAWGLRDPLRVFSNAGDGTFDEITDRAGVTGLTGGLNLIHADYDNDGDPDVLVLRGAWFRREGPYPNSLLRNRGDGTFEDATEAVGLLSFHPTQTAAWGDYDDDGDLDLFVGNESTPGFVHPCELFRNDGDGTFTEVAADVGLAHVGFVKGTAWGDYDNDGRIDLYLSRFGQPNVLYRNLGPDPVAGSWRFADVTRAAGVSGPVDSFPTWFFDYDNDGWLDLLVLPFPGFGARSLAAVVADSLGRDGSLERARLYRNRGDGGFDDVSVASAMADGMLAMGANFGDLDNDGYPDVYVGTGEPNLGTLVPNRMYRNEGGRRFVNVTVTGGFGHLQKGHGIAWGDLDNDGDQDIYAVMGGAFPADVAHNALFLNPGSSNRWLGLSLEGVEANRSAIGARIRVVTVSPAGRREVHATVGTGGSFGSSSLRQEIGLGAATAIERVEIRWPGAADAQVLSGLELDSAYRVVQGERPQRLELPAFDFTPTRAEREHGVHR